MECRVKSFKICWLLMPGVTDSAFTTRRYLFPSAGTLDPLDGSNMSADTYFHLRTLWTLCGHFGHFGLVQYVRRYLFPSADTLDPLDGSNMSADTYFHLRTLWTLCGHFGPFGWVQYVRRYLFPSADTLDPLRTLWTLWVGPLCPQILISICGHFGPSADTLDPLVGSDMSADTHWIS